MDERIKLFLAVLVGGAASWLLLVEIPELVSPAPRPCLDPAYACTRARRPNALPPVPTSPLVRHSPPPSIARFPAPPQRPPPPPVRPASQVAPSASVHADAPGSLQRAPAIKPSKFAAPVGTGVKQAARQAGDQEGYRSRMAFCRGQDWSVGEWQEHPAVGAAQCHEDGRFAATHFKQAFNTDAYVPHAAAKYDNSTVLFRRPRPPQVLAAATAGQGEVRAYGDNLYYHHTTNAVLGPRVTGRGCICRLCWAGGGFEARLRWVPARCTVPEWDVRAFCAPAGAHSRRKVFFIGDSVTLQLMSAVQERVVQGRVPRCAARFQFVRDDRFHLEPRRRPSTWSRLVPRRATVFLQTGPHIHLHPRSKPFLKQVKGLGQWLRDWARERELSVRVIGALPGHEHCWHRGGGRDLGASVNTSAYHYAWLQGYNEALGAALGGHVAPMIDLFPLLRDRSDHHVGSRVSLYNPDRQREVKPECIAALQQAHLLKQDCLHWCFPGPLAALVDILFHSLATAT